MKRAARARTNEHGDNPGRQRSLSGQWPARDERPTLPVPPDDNVLLDEGHAPPSDTIPAPPPVLADTDEHDTL
jgi:hypothetical protein